MPGKINFWSSSEANLVINPFQPSIAFHIKTSHLCCPHIGTSQLICFANQLTGFYMRATQMTTLDWNGLSSDIKLTKFLDEICNFVAPFHGWVSTASRLQSRFEEAVYFLSLSSWKFLVLIWSTTEGWKAELTLEPPSGWDPWIGNPTPQPLGPLLP